MAPAKPGLQGLERGFEPPSLLVATCCSWALGRSRRGAPYVIVERFKRRGPVGGPPQKLRHLLLTGEAGGGRYGVEMVGAGRPRSLTYSVRVPVSGAGRGRARLRSPVFPRRTRRRHSRRFVHDPRAVPGN